MVLLCAHSTLKTFSIQVTPDAAVFWIHALLPETLLEKKQQIRSIFMKQL